MSTRRGRVVSLEEVLQEAVNRAREIIEEKTRFCRIKSMWLKLSVSEP
ncbi:arginine--tRNA ligase [Paenibacillus larvae]|nr:arginine--tRNA ligase [Paenibacillus larvae]MDT2274374.1 arginine--tRNA ligase [Paenibacillus larvae]